MRADKVIVDQVIEGEGVRTVEPPSLEMLEQWIADGEFTPVVAAARMWPHVRKIFGPIASVMAEAYAKQAFEAPEEHGG